MNGVANLGWDEVRLPHPLFEGDTVYSKSEVLETRESKSRPKVGIVRVKTTGHQSGRHAGDRVHAHVHGLEARARPQRPRGRRARQARRLVLRARSTSVRSSVSRTSRRSIPRSASASPAASTASRAHDRNLRRAPRRSPGAPDSRARRCAARSARGHRAPDVTRAWVSGGAPRRARIDPHRHARHHDARCGSSRAAASNVSMPTLPTTIAAAAQNGMLNLASSPLAGRS